MDKKFIPSQVEERIYEFWEENSLLKAKNGKPFTILMPPPNANASLHAGHGMYTVEDILIRYKRLRGFSSLWIPGTDHAGFETQYVYEKHLAKQGKSRFDFNRQTLYDNISKFVKDNSGLIYSQFRKLGFLADWKRSVFTLDKNVLETVLGTFTKMEKEGYIYKDEYIVNYCTHCGTSLSELETVHVERKDPLYYLKYGPFVLATVRPETKFGDTAVAVHPKDRRYKKWVGKEIEVKGLLGRFKIKVIEDEMVDMKFGTGVVKITPAHDPNDFEAGKRHGLEVKRIINIDGRLNELTGPYVGLKVKQARMKVVEDLKIKGLIEKIDENYAHSVTVCYKCGRDLEPTIIPNWFIKVKELKKPVIGVIEKEKIKFFPKRYKKQILQWLKVMHDWPISRQIAWGIRIPVWYLVKDNENKIWISFIDKNREFKKGTIGQYLDKSHSLSEIKQGLQQVTVPIYKREKVKYVVSVKEPQDGQDWIQETDTFDTWFSSGQWPLVTLSKEEYKTRFPTDVMGTLADILPFWVSRMVMFSLYVKKEIPFKNVYLWSKVVDSKGQKMSKSKGNVINPIDLVNRYGADAFRASLIFGTGSGGNVPLAEEKVIGMRNFANKIWNIGRFIWMNRSVILSETKDLLRMRDSNKLRDSSAKPQNDIEKALKNLQKEFAEEKKKYLRFMDSYKFSQALGLVYEFLWRRFADYYIEELKSRLNTLGLTPRIGSELKEELRTGKIRVLDELQNVYFENLKMLHPFIPFVTEAVWKVFKGENSSILLERLKS
ncbi:valine--tRNA ligase [Candidatus Roizmanbacteria bacterium RIFCSPLOWO2_01_FULL_37_13]|uniref:Valine--tRNA ligase n=1 Tax=Candidatus Roizmanbacteria bacterium RIFCSPHIGHO2_02_FULL_38_11 TaxID=1802039 RepID=A0A1F7GY06_9BACT|nr:MAG: valine--tRNA ligase [Candidatus Roizmanbacteria bacterium RIFCSPHIGHO2_02_FULL_38_11]OGK42865.1 MAG: valine--tRNA ligase [Candidatus Roizmanbacteria bacterium RIFCSPLOWO2_01_FULL_37_13]